ncbi:MAG: hypothetical protein Q9165_004710 [Trypethelium subeluteriae]
MPRSSASPDPEADKRPLKKMRKGTHSCFECRRRKIRCIFSPENSSVCSECFARGSKCLGQNEVDVEASSIDNRKNLRERVAKLEALVEALSNDRTNAVHGNPQVAVDAQEAASNGKTQTNPQLEVPPTSLPESSDAPTIGQNNVPLLSIFDDEPHASVGSKYKTGEDILSTTNEAKQKKIKDSNTRRGLLANLPEDRTDLETSIANTEGWWRVTQRLFLGFCGFSMESTMAEFADFALTSENPVILGSFLLCLATNGQKNEQMYINIVSSLIISDDDYAATIEGIECMSLIAKYYNDIGRPRRAWMTFRRAIMFSQLLGLHRSHSFSARKDTIFWHLYEADRYLSLVLGLPHGLSDSHCEVNLDPNPGCEITVSTRFRRKAAVLAGKVVDRNQGVQNQSYSAALDLDQELDDLAARVNPKWWNLGEQTAHHDDVDFGIVHEARLAQIMFYEVKMYLHLPYMLKTATNPRYEFSRNACFDAAKKGLEIYHSLRCNYSEALQSFYDCQVVDFIGFTNAVVFLLGLLGYGDSKNAKRDLRDAEDETEWQLVYKTLDIFRESPTIRYNAVAQQSYEALDVLSRCRDCKCDSSSQSGPVVNIPYFGTLKLGKKSKFAEIVIQRSANNSTAPTPESQAGCAIRQMPTPPDQRLPDQSALSNTGAPSISYNGFYMPELDNYNYDISQGSGGFGGAASQPGANWWQLNANVDIDQDWNWFVSGY